MGVPWLFLAGAGVGLTLLLPFILRHWTVEAASGVAVSISIAIILGAATLMVVGIYQSFVPGMRSVWWGFAAVFFGAVIAYACAGISSRRDYHLAAILAVAIALCAGFTMSLVKGLDDNSYGIDHGTVVGQIFVRESTTFSCIKAICTPIHHPNQWNLVLSNCDTYDKCVTGALHFGEDVFGTYPVGSSYP